jgi:integrase
VDLARSTIHVRASKTDTGVRTVNIIPVLHDELSDYRARLDPEPDALVFPTGPGKPHSHSNIRSRVLKPAIEHANTKLTADGQSPLPEGLTHHSLRRTFVSLLFAMGETPVYVRDQAGHKTVQVTLDFYAKAMNRRDGEPQRLKALVEGHDWTATDSETQTDIQHTLRHDALHESETAQ